MLDTPSGTQFKQDIKKVNQVYYTLLIKEVT